MKYVYVKNFDGTPLMPCTPTKARKLLRSGKAEVIKRSPFTIQLNWQCEGHVQPVTIGIDKGSHKTGFCAVANGKILLCGGIHHRKDVKEKMDSRREHRRSRRNRKWYRKPRFNNRASSKRSGRLLPSMRQLKNSDLENPKRTKRLERLGFLEMPGILVDPSTTESMNP